VGGCRGGGAKNPRVVCFLNAVEDGGGGSKSGVREHMVTYLLLF